jgi:hypothetical protein
MLVSQDGLVAIPRRSWPSRPSDAAHPITYDEITKKNVAQTYARLVYLNKEYSYSCSTLTGALGSG